MKRSYATINDELDKLIQPKYFKAKALIFSLIMGLLLISGPMAILINLLIFVDYRKLLYLGMALLLILFVYTTDRAYLKLISHGMVDDIDVIYITDTLIMGFIILGMLLIIYELGVI